MQSEPIRAYDLKIWAYDIEKRKVIWAVTLGQTNVTFLSLVMSGVLARSTCRSLESGDWVFICVVAEQAGAWNSFRVTL